MEGEGGGAKSSKRDAVLGLSETEFRGLVEKIEAAFLAKCSAEVSMQILRPAECEHCFGEGRRDRWGGLTPSNPKP